MDYCLGDCQMTNLIFRAIQEARQVRRVTGKGYISSKPMPRLKSVEEVIQDPGSEQSWMDSPLLKTKFYEWIQEATGTKTLVGSWSRVSMETPITYYLGPTRV